MTVWFWLSHAKPLLIFPLWVFFTVLPQTDRKPIPAAPDLTEHQLPPHDSCRIYPGTVIPLSFHQPNQSLRLKIKELLS